MALPLRRRRASEAAAAPNSTSIGGAGTGVPLVVAPLVVAPLVVEVEVLVEVLVEVGPELVVLLVIPLELDVLVEVDELVLNEAPLSQIKKAAEKTGFVPMIEDAVTKVLEGKTSLEDVFIQFMAGSKDNMA